MKSHPLSKTLTGLIASAMLAAVSQADVTLSDFSSFALSGTYVQWDSGTFTSGATAFRVQAGASGGGYKNLSPAINASGEDTISIKLDVNPGNVADKFNIVLIDGDGTERAYRFDGVTVGNNQTFTKNVANFLQDNAPGSVPGLNLANLTVFHLQGTFANSDAMDMTFDNLSLMAAPFVPDTIFNGDFEITNGAGWGTTQGTPTYPTSGGNPNGNAVLTSDGGFAVLYAFNNTEKPFASLGLSPGDNYILQMDMKVISGDIGGIRLEGPAGYVVDQFAPANTGGSDWATYSFALTVPASPAQAKFGIRTPNGSSVAFDNVKIVLPGPPEAPQLTIKTGTLVGWTAASAVNTYQAQSSPDEGNWTNIGPVFTGNTVSGVFDADTAAYYQVLEITPATPGNAVLNPGFETSAFSSTPADNWMIAPQFNATATTVGSYGAVTPHGGTKMLQLDAQTSAGGTPAEVGVRSNDYIAVTANTAYNLTFYASNQVTGASFVLGAKLRYYNDFNTEIGLSPETSFGNVGGAWTQVSKAFTTPNGTAFVKIDFFLRSGAVPSVQWVTLIDDVELITPLIPGNTTAIPATAQPGVEVSWPTLTGSNYQVFSSENLGSWSTFGGSITGNGTVWSIVDTLTPPRKFYRVLQTTP